MINRNKIILLTLFHFLLVVKHGYGQNEIVPNPINDPSWNARDLMSDDFNYEWDTINHVVYDSTKWQYNYSDTEHRLSACVVGDLVHVSIQNPGPNGFLRLKATDTPSSCTDHQNTVWNEDHSVGGLFGLDSIQYAFIEVKMRIPIVTYPATHEGSGAAIWMFRKGPWDNKWSEIDLAEIDCMDNRHTCNVIWDPHENKPGLDSSHIHYAGDWPGVFNDTHCGYPGWHENVDGWANIDSTTWDSNSHDNMRCPNLTNGCSSCDTTSQLPDPDFNLANGWHKYQMLWTKEKVVVWVDGNYVNSTTLGCPGLEPMNLIISTTVADTMDGGKTNQFSKAINPSTIFPFDLDVDYIRTYELDYDCGNSINDCYFNVMDYDHKVKESITFGNCVNTSVDVGSGIYMKAAEFIQINGGFEVPIGAEFQAEIFGCP